MEISIEQSLDIDEEEDILDDNSSQGDKDNIETQGYSGSEMKPLNRNDLKRIFDEILGAYDQCTENVQFAVCSLAISTKEISNSDGRLTGIMSTDKGKEPFSLEHSMKQIINQHKNAFMPSKGIYNPANHNLLPTPTQVRKQTTKRLKSK